MNNVVEINSEKAVIAFDPEIQMLRGEFVGLNGGADLYAENVHYAENHAAATMLRQQRGQGRHRADGPRLR